MFSHERLESKRPLSWPQREKWCVVFLLETIEPWCDPLVVPRRGYPRTPSSPNQISTNFPNHLCRIRASHRHGHLGRLLSSADNALTCRVTHNSHILVLHLSPLPDLDLAATTKDAHTHGAKQVVRSVGVQVDTTVEDGCGILSNG